MNLLLRNKLNNTTTKNLDQLLAPLITTLWLINYLTSTKLKHKATEEGENRDI